MCMLYSKICLLFLLGGLNSLSRLLSVSVSCPKERALSSLLSISTSSTYWVCDKRFQLVWYRTPHPEIFGSTGHSHSHVSFWSLLYWFKI